MTEPDERFDELLAAFVEENASVGEMRELMALLSGSPERMGRYLDVMEIHAMMQCRGKQVSRGKRSGDSSYVNGGSTRLWWKSAAAAAILLTGVALWRLAVSGFPGSILNPPSVPAVCSSVQLIRSVAACGLALPQKLPGSLRLAAGEVTVRLESGAELTLVGPVGMEALDGMHVRLAYGRLMADVPPRAIGFTVRTTGLEMRDLGTVFGVSTGEGGTDVFVFKGCVQVNTGSGENVSCCAAGEGVRAKPGVRPVKFAAEGEEAQSLLAMVRTGSAFRSSRRMLDAAVRIVDLCVERDASGATSAERVLSDGRGSDGEEATIARFSVPVQKETSEMNTSSVAAVLAATVVTMGAGTTAAKTPCVYWAAPVGTNGAACTEADPGTIQAAFNKTVSATNWAEGDTVILKEGLYDYTGKTGTVNGSVSSLPSYANVSCNYLTIRSENNDSAATVIVGDGTNTNARGLGLRQNILLSGVTVSNCTTATGNGGGIFCYGTTEMVSNCVILGNHALNGGGVYNGQLFDCTLFENTATTAGGGANGPILVSGCVFSNNKATSQGALYMGGVGVSILNSTFDSNASTGSTSSGTVYLINRGTVSNCVFRYNTAAAGGGALASYDSASRAVTAMRCLFETNFSLKLGGAVYRGIYADSRFVGNTVSNASYGGGACYEGSYSNCTFIGNTAIAGSGGAGANATFSLCVFTNNTALVNSGGALNSGSASDCTFFGNSAPLGNGGGTYNTKPLTRCVFVGNVAASCAAVYIGVATNCLFVANQTTGTDVLKGIIRDATLVNCTIADNVQAGTSGGAVSYGCTLYNTLVHGNTPYDLSYTTTAYHSLYGTKNPSYAVSGSDNIVSDIPKFAGTGSAYPYALTRGSPAINAGMDVGWTAQDIDLAGAVRLNGAVDIGAYEYWPDRAGTFVSIK